MSMRCCNRKEHQIFKLDGRQKREASRKKLLEMPAPSSVYVSGLSPLNIVGFSARRPMASMMPVQVDCIVTCAQCSA